MTMRSGRPRPSRTLGARAPTRSADLGVDVETLTVPCTATLTASYTATLTATATACVNAVPLTFGVSIAEHGPLSRTPSPSKLTSRSTPTSQRTARLDGRADLPELGSPIPT